MPTLNESGFPGFDLHEWTGLFGPAGLPGTIVQRLHEALTEALADPGVRARLDQIGALPIGTTPQEFARFVQEGRQRMAALVREAGISLD